MLVYTARTTVYYSVLISFLDLPSTDIRKSRLLETLLLQITKKCDVACRTTEPHSVILTSDFHGHSRFISLSNATFRAVVQELSRF